MSENLEGKEVPEEVVIGDQAFQEHLKKVPAKYSAEVRMVLYVVPMAIILVTIAYFLSKLQY